jgi:RNA polymerase-binding transcription factor DksA
MTTQNTTPAAAPSTTDNERDEFVSPEVMDEGDAASLFQMNENQKAIAAVVARNAPEKHPDFDGETCIACGEFIPAERLALGKIRCVDCQSALEKRGKLFAAPSAN